MNDKAKMGIAIGMGVTLVAALTALGIILYFFFTIDEATARNESMFSSSTASSISLTDDAALVAVYDGPALYLGGRAVKENFTVRVVSESEGGEGAVITDYTCPFLDDPDYRIDSENTVFKFTYGDLNTTLLVSCDDIRMYPFAPNYLTVKVDESAAQMADAIASGSISYTDAYADWGFTGDSQIAALSVYDLIPESSVIAEVGCGLDFLENNYDRALAAFINKKVIVMHFGINTLTTSRSGRDLFVAQYEKLITMLKRDIKGVRIIVDGIFPVADKIYYNQDRFAYINEANMQLLEMCLRLDVDYWTNNEFITYNQNYFAADGLHLNAAFYKEYWLVNLMKEMGSAN